MSAFDLVDAEETLQALDELWTGVQQMIATRPLAEWTQDSELLAHTQARLVANGEWVSGPSSIMSVLGIARAEVLDCRVLRWVFDPLARHGLGASMLRRLSAAVGVEFGDPNSVTVEAEVSRQNSRADLGIAGPDGEVVVEAKIDAVEQPDQAARLESDWPDAAALVFLTPGCARLPTTATTAGTSRWQHLSWAVRGIVTRGDAFDG